MVEEHQSKLFTLLGNSLNALIYKASKENEKFAKDFDIDYLIQANKTVFYNSCDDRLKCFIDALTARNTKSNDDLNFK